MDIQDSVFYLDHKAGRTVSVKNNEFLFFSGYNYLGISHQNEFAELVTEGLSKYGWLFPSSRISNTRLSLFEECESMLSAITGSEDSVLLPSGFAAGQLATSRYGKDIYNAPGSHPAITRNTSALSDFDDWSKWLLKTANKSSPDQFPAFATNSLDPLTATLYNFSFIQDFHKPVKAILDDSHGIGLTGKNGAGVSSLIPASTTAQYTFTYSLSKALGIPGGAISCMKEEADYLRSMSGYTAVSPLSPAMIYAFTRAQSIYAVQRKKLYHNIERFAELTKNLPGIKHDPSFPVFVLPENIRENFLEENNIIISAFAYPDPSGPRVKRIVLNALHTLEDLERLTSVLEQAYHQTAQ